MASRKLFAEWHGYDKTVKPSDNTVSPNSITNGREHSTAHLSPKIAEWIRDIYSPNNRSKIARLYFPEVDGRTDQDFIDWISGIENSLINPYDNWRVAKVIESHPDYGYEFQRAIRIFFKYGERSDRVLRAIELNEFAHRGEADQTLEDFLQNDVDYRSKCEDLLLKHYTSLSPTLFEGSVPKFLNFGSSCPVKGRDLLLQLTQEEMKKVLDYRNHPYYEASLSDSSVKFIEFYIYSALNGAEDIVLKELTPRESSNAVMAAFLSGQKNFWDNLGTRKDTQSSISILFKELERISFTGDNFKKYFSHMIKTGALDNLSPVEVIAVALGYEKPHRWAEPNKGTPTIALITKMMLEDDLDSEFVAKLIAHIIVNNLELIVVNEELATGAWEDMHIDWAYSMITKSNQKRKLVHPTAITTLL